MIKDQLKAYAHLSVFILAGCDKDFEQINTNPSRRNQC